MKLESTPSYQTQSYGFVFSHQYSRCSCLSFLFCLGPQKNSDLRSGGRQLWYPQITHIRIIHHRMVMFFLSTHMSRAFISASLPSDIIYDWRSAEDSWITPMYPGHPEMGRQYPPQSQVWDQTNSFGQMVVVTPAVGTTDVEVLTK